jgi:hypothetical protein
MEDGKYQVEVAEVEVVLRDGELLAVPLADLDALVVQQLGLHRP